MFTVLKVNKEKADERTLKKAVNSLTSLQHELGTSPSFGQIEEAMIEGLTGTLPARFYEEGLTDAELQSAQKIAESWYAKSGWTQKRGLKK
jgi:lipoate-protein ligase A